jgi:hypothetical protein
VAGNGELTSEACDVVEEDNVEGEDRGVDGETIHGRAPQLHRKEGNVRRPLISNEHHQKESSPMIGGR